jgi:SagB-type dehydrogenase family enzyme
MNDAQKIKIMELREAMKGYLPTDEGFSSDQTDGLPQPPLEKAAMGTKTIPLTREFEGIIQNNNFLGLLNTRCSRRQYSDIALSIGELSFLLWATQGIKKIVGKTNKAAFRTVPSAGARHPFETYLFVNKVEGLEPGLYHYLAAGHKLELVKTLENQIEQLSAAYFGQTFFGGAPVAFVWTVVPYRTEWRYSIKAHRYALIDIGHVCQNLYLACEAIHCGTCAIGAYDQTQADNLLDLDSRPSFCQDNEFVLYAASVGKVQP